MELIAVPLAATMKPSITKSFVILAFLLAAPASLFSTQDFITGKTRDAVLDLLGTPTSEVVERQGITLRYASGEGDLIVAFREGRAVLAPDGTGHLHDFSGWTEQDLETHVQGMAISGRLHDALVAIDECLARSPDNQRCAMQFDRLNPQYVAYLNSQAKLLNPGDTLRRKRLLEEAVEAYPTSSSLAQKLKLARDAHLQEQLAIAAFIAAQHREQATSEHAPPVPSVVQERTSHDVPATIASKPNERAPTDALPTQYSSQERMRERDGAGDQSARAEQTSSLTNGNDEGLPQSSRTTPLEEVPRSNSLENFAAYLTWGGVLLVVVFNIKRCKTCHKVVFGFCGPCKNAEWQRSVEQQRRRDEDERRHAQARQAEQNRQRRAEEERQRREKEERERRAEEDARRHAQEQQSRREQRSRTQTAGRSSTSAYDVLGISKNATQQQIKSAYKAELLKYHPDRVAHLAPEFRKMAEARTKAIIEAYRELVESA